MKLTWFGGTCVRIHIGGMILVLDAEAARPGIDASELVSGADQIIAGFGAALAAAEPTLWRPRKAQRPLDTDSTATETMCWRLGAGAVVIDAPEEAPLLLLNGEAGEVPTLGRWVDGAVVVLFGDGDALGRLGQGVLGQRAPRLLALAGEETAIDQAIGSLRTALDGTGLMALDAMLAVEI